MVRVGVADTTFARVDMARYAIEAIQEIDPNAEIVRYTVPGIKDLPVAALRLIEEFGCDGVITLGWVGSSLTDKLSYVVASMGLILVQLKTRRHVIDVTVHEDEASSPEELRQIAIDRARKHARNLMMLLLEGPEALTPWAGKGLRQGRPDVGPIE
ncbi:riboflavin synthase [Pyrolobus fumarii 1A]|uniref:Riboflavin synthase n=1 Tax=Pyrolobus fumarii (strain DSM 11204 / 1A) TaxID=694429 RepID=G0EGE7_PYRF1|nr:riboflavin synthase [Pyrolobus fumarii]AEM39172.1 riboflavin synthase [Pyrolobus fumarii 1A]